jgi:ribosomal protein L7/L12
VPITAADGGTDHGYGRVVIEVLLVVVLVALVAAVLLTAARVVGSRADADRRLRAVEERLAAIAAHLGVAEPDHSSEVVALADDGRLVEAIRAHRRRTGAGLAEAKRYVDEVAQRRREG